MSPSPRVSVVVPCWNQAHFLDDCVGSLLASDYEDFEIVIVDDGSPDDTREVAKRLIAQHPDRQLRLVERENGGLPAARNSGIAAARGELILPLDSDDMVGPRYLSLLVEALDREPGISIAWGTRVNFGLNSEVWHPLPYDWGREILVNSISVAAMFRRAAWEEVGGYDERFDSYEDWDFWIACGEHGHVGRAVPAAVWNYRVREGSMVAGAIARDEQLKAQLLLNHPRVYSRRQLAWGLDRFESPPARSSTPVFFMPQLEGDDPALEFEARSLLVIAHAAELVESPALLQAWGRTFGPADDVSLAILGDLGQPLLDVLAELGLDGEDGPDLVALGPFGPRLGLELAHRAEAVLSEREPETALRGLEHVGSAELAELRTHCEARLAGSRRPLPRRFAGPRRIQAPTPAELPSVSVIVTAYNVGEYLRRSIDSGLAQDYAGPFEVIVVDDGSTDDVPEIIASYGDRIRSVRKPNGGLTSAVNAGLELATGELIASLDGDDIWPLDKLSRQATYLAEHPDVGLVHGDMELIDADDRLIHPSYFAWANSQPTEGDIYERLLIGNFVAGGASMFRSALAREFAPVSDAAAYPDWWIAARIANVATIKILPGCHNRYRMHGANMTLGANPSNQIKGLRNELRFRRFTLTEAPSSRARIEVLGAVLQYLDHSVSVISQGENATPQEIVEVSDGERTAALEAVAAGDAVLTEDREAAVRHYLRALGSDPASPDARARIAA
jgi:glycosyltransferase involved in cell wall biosynthesis